MTVYECPVCQKYLVTEEEPPGIIHKCGDCAEQMVKVTEMNEQENDDGA